MDQIFSSSLWGRKHRVLFASVTIGVLLLAGKALAASKTTSFIDVGAGAWYEESARHLVDLGALDSSEARLRPNDLATRAEMIELLVRLRNQPLQSPARQSFTDVAKTASYYQYMETAARVGWLHGDDDCYGTVPCTARPRDGVNRAEAATLLMRVFALPSIHLAPVFADNGDENAWYYGTIQTAADHCVLQGDDRTHLVRPAYGMNRAEMIVMFDRASLGLKYGTNCGTLTQPQADISSAVAISSTRVRLTFTIDLNSSRAVEEFRYAVSAIGGGSLSISDVTMVNSRTVDLTLGASLQNQQTYRVNVLNAQTDAGTSFSVSDTFTFSEALGKIKSVTAVSALKLRIVFNADMSLGTLDDSYRYAVRTVTGNTFIGVNSAVIVDSRTVDLTLSSGAQTNVGYMVNVTDLMTVSGVRFNDSATFVFGEPAATMTSVTALTPSILRINFSADLDELTVENVARYRVTGNGRDLAIVNAHLVGSRVIDLMIAENLENQRIYAVKATDLKTAGGIIFTDTTSLLFVGSSDLRFASTLIGAKEVPSIVVALSGTGTFTLNASGLSYDLTLANMSGSVVTGAHIHRGATGVNGAVLSSITFTGTRATGTWSGLSEQDRNDLLAGGMYVNVHTQAHPDGAIRGQVISQ